MSGAPIITGLMIFFSATTVAVIAYPLVKLLPSWLERSMQRKVAFHRDAIGALDAAIVQAADSPDQQARLRAQQDYNRAALAALVPGVGHSADPKPHSAP